MNNKLIISETQYNHLVNYINEATNHSLVLINLLADNSGIKFISFIRNDKQKIDFRLDKFNGHDIIMNIQKGAMYFNFYGDFRPKTMLYGNSIHLNYTTKMVLNKEINRLEPKEGSWREVLTNIIGIEIYDASNNKLDSAELDSDTSSSEKSTKPTDELIVDYNNQFNNLKDGQAFNLTAINSYEGVVLRKTGNSTTFELANRKNKTKVFTCEFTGKDDAGNEQSIFRKNTDGSIIFTAVKFIEGGLKSSKAPIIVNGVKDFIVKAKDKTPEELEKDKTDDESAKALEAEKKAKKDSLDAEENEKKDTANAKKVYDTIMNNPDLKKAFFKQPTLLGLIKAGDPIGIVPAKELLNNYSNKTSEKQISEMDKKFPLNTVITFEVLDKDLVIKDAGNFKVSVGVVYKATVQQREISTRYVKCIHADDGAGVSEFFLNIYPQKNDTNKDVYPAQIKMQQSSDTGRKYNYPPSEMGKIKITNYKFN